MWSFLKSILGVSSRELVLSPDFELYVQTAIDILGKKPATITDQQIVSILIDNGISPGEAEEILIFLPIAFVRHWLPDVRWHDTYMEQNERHGEIEKRFSETESFEIIWKVTGHYFHNQPNADTIMKIGGRSADLHAINNALLAMPGCNVADLKISQTVIIR